MTRIFVTHLKGQETLSSSYRWEQRVNNGSRSLWRSVPECRVEPTASSTSPFFPAQSRTLGQPLTTLHAALGSCFKRQSDLVGGKLLPWQVSGAAAGTKSSAMGQDNEKNTFPSGAAANFSASNLYPSSFCVSL